MATRVTEITDESNPGFGFFAVDGVPGFHRKEIADRVARQMDAAAAITTEAKAEAAADVPPSNNATVVCPSCGHPFGVRTLLDKFMGDLHDQIEAGKKAAADLQAQLDAAKAAAPTPAPATPLTPAPDSGAPPTS